jgi:transcriptional regulator with XRE-family HTH domain
MPGMQTLRFSPGRMRKARLRRGWSQSEFARQLNTAEQNVGRWERGANKPGADAVAAMARATGHDIEFFYVDGDAEDDEEEAALRRRADEILAPLNDEMVDALLSACRARVAIRNGNAA